VFRRAGFRCEFVERTGQLCGSRRFLEVEHRTPFARGGTNELANLELLCRDLNLIRGIRAFGPDRMKRS
jgi:5-methylcytosine-specific restriction endonuclease McrA